MNAPARKIRQMSLEKLRCALCDALNLNME
jgi:hypothetical protein